MVTEVGNLALPISFPGFEMFDRVEQAMARLNRLEQPIRIPFDAGSANTLLTANQQVIASEQQVANAYAATAQAHQRAIAMERTAITERIQVLRSAAQQEIAIEKELTQQVLQATQQRQQAEMRATQVISQQQAATGRASRFSPTGITGSTGSSIARTAITGGSAETAIASLIAPEVTIPLAIAFAASKFILEPLLDAIDVEAQRIAQTAAEKTLTIHFNAEFDLARSNQPAVSVETRNRLMEEAQDIQAMIKGEGAGGGNKTAVAELQKRLDAINQTLSNTASVQKSTDALKVLGAELSDLTTDYDHHRKSLEGASYQAQIWARYAIEGGADATKVSDAVDDWTAAINRNADALQKQRDAEVRASAIDVANFQKFQIQSVADAQIAAANKSADAWKAAAQVVGQIDIAKGFSSLADSSAPLHQVVTDLAALGKNDAHLTGLMAIADSFKDITDAEKSATVAYAAYIGMASETDVRITKLQQLKKAYDDAALASPAGSDLRAGRLAVDANVDAQIARLRVNQAGSLLEAVKVTPDFAGFDDQIRAKIGEQGGPPALAMRVGIETTLAAQDLDRFEKQDRAAVIKITADTKDATAAIDALIAHMPTSIPLLITTPVGSPNPARGYDGGGAAGGATMTPRGNASNLIPYADLIQQAANANQIPAWLLGAIIEHESGGNVGAVQPGGLGRGLTQVDIGQNPGYDERRLTGTSREDAAYQINSGAEILKRFFDQYGGDAQKAIQNYAGPAYRSQAGGGVPAGLDFATELTNYYKQQVQAALANADPTRGYGSGGTLPGYGPGDTALGSSQVPTGGALNVGPGSGVGPSAIAAAAQQHIGEQKDRFARDVYGWCLEVTQDILQEAGINERAQHPEFSHTADERVRAAMQGLPGAGTVIPQSQARSGDLVGWLGSSAYAGDPAGHIGVVSQNNNYIGTTKQGVQERPIGPDAIFIRPDGVVAGGPVPGSTMYKGASAAGGTLDLSDPTTAAAQRALMQQQADANDLATSLANIVTAGKQVNEQFAKMGAVDVSAAIQQFQTLQPMLEKMALAKLPEGASDADKQIATNAALGQTLELTAAWGQALSDIRDKTGNLAADQQRITDLIGGPMAANLNHQLSIMNEQAAIADRIAQLTQRKTDLEAAHTKLLADRQAADTAESRAQTRQGWADQEADRKLAARSQAETLANTIAMRGFENRQRALTQYGTLQKQQLDQNLIDLEKTHSLAVSATLAQNQILSSRAFAGDTSASMRLAIGRDATANANTAFATDKQKIQDAMTAEAKLASQQQYDLETERVTQQRASEDRLQAISNEGIQNQANRAARDQSHTIDQWQIEDIRAREDARYTLAQTSLDNEIKAQQDLATQADANLKAAQDALSVWQQTGVDVGAVGTALDATAQHLTSYLNAVAVSGPNTVRRLDGFASGGVIPMGSSGIVGDAAGGMLTAYSEYVTVTPRGAVVRPMRNVAPASPAGTSGGKGDVHLHFEGDATLDDAAVARIKAFVRSEIDAAKPRNAGRNMGALRG